MQGTVNACKEIGYTDPQAELMGRIDDLFEEAIKVGLLPEEDVLTLGKTCGKMAGKFTGKI